MTTGMRIDVVTLVPSVVEVLRELGVVGRALSAGIAELHTHNPRDFALDRHRKVDDLPYGGGAGMVLKPEPVFAAMGVIPRRSRCRVLMMTPQGRPLQQSHLQDWARNWQQLVLLCGHYEGFDERIRSLADEEVSVGDYVLTGGELPAMSVINGVIRLLPGTVGTSASLEDESHSALLLEHPHYTRPAVFEGMAVPDVLRSGDHGAVQRWRDEQRRSRTEERRPGLYHRWRASRGGQGADLESSSSTLAPERAAMMGFRIGNGYDIHRLVPGRPLTIGGVNLEHPAGLGLDGHSDADVLVHALMDALLGALSLGDIGRHFPPSDPRWRGADSLMLLARVMDLIREQGWTAVNVDSVVIAERPKLKPHIEAMRANLASRLNLDPTAVGVKATTNEQLGAEGREEGISAQAVALLQRLGSESPPAPS